MDKNEKKIQALITTFVNENTELIIKFLKFSFSNQKFFIKLIEHIINKSSIQDSTFLQILHKLNNILPDIILHIGIPLCELLNEEPTILNYYYDLYFQNDSMNKNILLSFINIFNYESVVQKPADDFIEKLKYKSPNTFLVLNAQKRKNKTEIENLYDELTSLFTNLRKGINIENKFDDKILKYFELSIKEKSDKIMKFEKENKFTKATIEFFQEKIKNLEYLFNEINKDKNQNNHNPIKKELVHNDEYDKWFKLFI